MSKTDFTPVKGGHNDGRTFKTHITRAQSVVPFLALLGMFIVVLVMPSEFEGEMGWYYGVLTAIIGILVLWWKLFIIKHWNTLKAEGPRTERILQEQRDKNKNK
jgi:hypothetical protein